MRRRHWGTWYGLVLAILAILGGATSSFGQDPNAELRALVEQQSRQLEEQRRQLEALRARIEAGTTMGVMPAGGLQGQNPAPGTQPPATPPGPKLPDGSDSGTTKPDASTGKGDASSGTGAKKEDDKSTDTKIENYLKDHPGAGVPPGVQFGYAPSGFYLRSAPNPNWGNWNDQSKIPFELRMRGQMQLAYIGYKVTDSYNHLTQVDTGHNLLGDFSQLEAKRARIIFEGNVFDPNLRFNLTFDGNTRGIIGTAGPPALGIGATGIGGPTGPSGGTPITVVDHTVRIYNAFAAYDFRPCWSQKGCGPDCPEGTYSYSPTFTAIAGKFQPFFGLEEILGTRNMQFVEFSMADYFFDSDDNNQLMMAGFQAKAFDDRLFMQGVISNGNESQTANIHLDRLPGFMLGGWYDFGGTFNREQGRWDLFGDSLADIDYSCNPVLRMGGAVNLVPMDRRSQYSSAELTRVRVAPGGPNGTQLIQLLTGDGRGTALANGETTFAADKYDSYTFEVFQAFKYRGFSLSNDMWFRNVNNIRGLRIPGPADNPILYSTPLGGPGVTAAALFPGGKGLFDYGQQVQGGYFLVPKKFEVVGRWSWIRGNSGNINGDNTFQLVNVPGVPGGPVKVVNGAFTKFATIDELAMGVNWYFYRQQVKWQTDLSLYRGGNPAQGGASPAGFIPGVDGYMLRTQLQLAF